MRNDAFVRWTQWNETGVFASGHIMKSEVEGQLQRFEKQAKQALEETGVDHVIYGAKVYSDCTDEDGNKRSVLTEVRFYMLTLDDEEFYKRTSAVKNEVIYALHKR